MRCFGKSLKKDEPQRHKGHKEMTFYQPRAFADWLTN
jgi:hypothetical protein